jgi:hypothetical protein
MSQLNKKEPYVISLYNNGHSIGEICKLTEISNGSVYKILNNNKIPLNRKRRYSVNDNFFESIDSIEKAYTLGFIVADGHNNIAKNLLSIQLHPQDVDVLEKIIVSMGANNPIKHYQYGDNKKVCLSINSFKICEDLLKLGVTQNKTYNVYLPKISDNLMKYLILGIFDGDGSISIDKARYNKGILTITGTKEIIFSISDIFKKECNVNSYINERHKERDNNNYTLSISGNIQIIRLLDWLYDGSTIFLDRKREKYLLLKNIVNDRLTKIENRETQKINSIKEKEETQSIKENEILDLYTQNLSIRQIKDKTAYDRRFISKVIKSNELQIRDKSSYSEYRLKRIKEHYNK